MRGLLRLAITLCRSHKSSFTKINSIVCQYHKQAVLNGQTLIKEMKRRRANQLPEGGARQGTGLLAPTPLMTGMSVQSLKLIFCMTRLTLSSLLWSWFLSRFSGLGLGFFVISLVLFRGVSRKNNGWRRNESG